MNGNMNVETFAAQNTLVGMIGLGRMGSGMARNLLAKGFDLIILKASGAIELDSLGARRVDDIEVIGADARVIFFSLPNSEALEKTATALANHTSRSRDAGVLVIETSTLALADKLRARVTLEKAGIQMLDCPLVGGALQARDGALTVLASGERGLYEMALPVLQAVSAQQYYVGAFGESSKLKLVVNHLINITNVLAAETMLIAKCCGLDLRLVNQVIGSGPAGSGLWRGRVPLMLDGVFDDPARQSGELNIPLKDNELISELIAQLGVNTPLFDAVRPIYALALNQGRQRHDPATLFATLESIAQKR